MSIIGFLARNTLRNKRRLALSVLSVGVSLFLLVTLMVTLRELTKPVNDEASALRVCVRNKLSLAALLPQRQRAFIERQPGVEVCSTFVWFGGKFDDEQLPYGTIATDADKILTLIPEMRVDDAQYQDFLKDRTTCIVGEGTLNSDIFKKLGLKVGSKFTLKSGIYPTDLELRIAGVYRGTVDDRNIFFHHDYLDKLMGDWGKTGMWWLKVRDAAAMEPTCQAIEAEFANTAHEVRAESERAFQLSFVSMFGNIKLVFGAITSAVLLGILFVTASTMSMSIRERFRELAILKAIGFQQRDLVAFILAESFGLAMLGALIGAGGAWALYTFSDMTKATGGMFPSFDVTPTILGTALLVACALGLLSAVFPAISAARMSVVQGLKTLD